MTSELELIQTPAPVPGNADRHAALVGAWLASLASENTCRAYRRNLRDFAAWLDRDRLDLLETGRVHLDVYRQTLAGAPSTVARTLAALSSFYGYAVEAGALEANPVQRVRRPKVDADHSDTQGLTRDQARALLDAGRADGARSHALVALLLFTGIRLSEALGATTADYGHDNGHRTLTVTRKGGKRDKVAVPAPAVEALNAYLGATGQDLVMASAEALPIFTTATGRPWAASEAFRTVQRLARTAGIEGKISPHSLRHTFATLALETGTALHDLQDSMGHADPRTTRRYDRARGKLEKSASYDVARALA